MGNTQSIKDFLYNSWGHQIEFLTENDVTPFPGDGPSHDPHMGFPKKRKEKGEMVE